MRGHMRATRVREKSPIEVRRVRPEMIEKTGGTRKAIQWKGGNRDAGGAKSLKRERIGSPSLAGRL